jgi:hypothetical protein
VPRNNLGDAVITAVLLIVAISAVVAALAWPERTRLFPLVVSMPLAALLAGLLGRKLRSSDLRSLAGTGGEDAELARASWRETGIAAGWLLGFFVGVWTIGLLWSVIVYTFIYLRLAARESLAFSSAGAFGAWVLCFGLFDRLLHLPLPAGLVAGLI